MARMKPPKVPNNPPDVLRVERFQTLLKTCEKDTSYEGRRDAAIIRVFVDTGARLQEMTNLRWNPDEDNANDVDLEMGILRVLGKGPFSLVSLAIYPTFCRATGISALNIWRSNPRNACTVGL